MATAAPLRAVFTTTRKTGNRNKIVAKAKRAPTANPTMNRTHSESAPNDAKSAVPNTNPVYPAAKTTATYQKRYDTSAKSSPNTNPITRPSVVAMKPSPNTAEMSAAPAMNPATKPQIGSRMKKYRSPARQNATPMITARIPIRISTVPLLVQNLFEFFRGTAESG